MIARAISSLLAAVGIIQPGVAYPSGESVAITQPLATGLTFSAALSAGVAITQPCAAALTLQIGLAQSVAVTEPLAAGLPIP